ncbi:hypothetical protein GQ600_25750 [Phytophthora cactorum]|nr:hypothetical protein GQ600_25750 [Phytophthora cactorum]
MCILLLRPWRRSLRMQEVRS